MKTNPPHCKWRKKLHIKQNQLDWNSVKKIQLNWIGNWKFNYSRLDQIQPFQSEYIQPDNQNSLTPNVSDINPTWNALCVDSIHSPSAQIQKWTEN